MVAARNPPPATIEAPPASSATARARARSEPVVFSSRNRAPCAVNSASVASPPSSAYGLSSVNRFPV